jgi:hypothetical protein
MRVIIWPTPRRGRGLICANLMQKLRGTLTRSTPKLVLIKRRWRMLGIGVSQLWFLMANHFSDKTGSRWRYCAWSRQGWSHDECTHFPLP